MTSGDDVEGSSLALGVDLVLVADVAHSIEQFGARYTRRLFTDSEIGYCMSAPHLVAERFAVRFAAKEATTKLLRVESDALIWRDIEVERDARGWCDIVLHGDVRDMARRQGLSDFAHSMSHERAYAMATVVARRTRFPNSGRGTHTAT